MHEMHFEREFLAVNVVLAALVVIEAPVKVKLQQLELLVKIAAVYADERRTAWWWHSIYYHFKQ